MAHRTHTRYGVVSLKMAVVVPRDESTFIAEELVAFCEDKLARYKIPRLVSVVAELPRNAAGKVLKRLLREELS